MKKRSKRDRITRMKSLQLVRAFGFYTRELIEAYATGSMYNGIVPDHLRDQLVSKAIQIEADAILDMMLELPDLAEKVAREDGFDLLVEAGLAEISIAGMTLESFCDFLEGRCGIDLD